MGTLKSKTLRGASWSFLENIASVGITFVVGVVLAQLLTPAEFGVIGIIMIFIAVGNTFIEVGFNSAIIRKVDVTRQDFNTVFWLSCGTGVFLYLLLWATAPAIGGFFNQPDIYPQIRVTGLMLPLGAATVIQRAILTRAMNFKTQTIVTVISSLLSGGIGVIMAFNGMGVWSLVTQIVSRMAIQTFLFWFLCTWFPRFEFSRESFRELFSYSSKLLGAALIETLYRNVYNLIIGKSYSAASLGQYNRAAGFTGLTAITLTNVVQKVSFPALSSIQNEPERLKEAYRKIIKTTMIVVFAMMLGMAAIAKPLILILIGPQWVPAIYFLQILCLSDMFYPLHTINLNIINVVGRTDIFLKLEIIKKLIAIPTIFIGIFWGLDQMLWSGVAVSVICYLLNVHYSAALVDYSLREQLADILPSLSISLAVALVMWSFSFLDIHLYLMLALQIVTGLTLAVLVYEKFRPAEYIEIKAISLQLINKLRNVRK